MYARILAVASVAALASTSAFAAGATGTAGRNGKTVKVVDACVYHSKAEMIGQGPRLRLRLSPVPLDGARLAAALNVEAELDRQAKDQGYVELELETDGRWTGGGTSVMKDAFCGWCHDGSQAAMAQTKVANGRVTGTIKASHTDNGKKEGYDIQVTLDVPILPETGIAALPAGGGEAGRAYLACLKAVAGKQEAAVASSCFTRDDEWMAQRSLDDFTGDQFADFVRGMKPELAFRNVTVTGGRAKGDQAELTVTGKSVWGGTDGQPETLSDWKGVISMRRAAGVWGFAGARQTYE